MIVTVFRSRLRADAAATGYAALAAAIEQRARSMPGFIDFKTFTAGDGERVSIVIFDSIEHHDAWRDDPEHRLQRDKAEQDRGAARMGAAGREAPAGDHVQADDPA